MAKVISWAIQKGSDVRYVYIDNPSVLRTDRITDRGTLSNIARIDQSTYQTNFTTLYNTVKSFAGTESISLINDWSQYWNALGTDASIVLLAGLDGRNTSSDDKPYYTLHFTNQVIGVGLGGDNILDNTARTKSFIFFERNGVEYTPTSIQSDNPFVSVGSGINNEYEIIISSGLQFQQNGDILLPVEVTFTVYKDTFSAKALFTILPIKNGVDGDTYNLVVVPRQVKVASDDIFEGAVVKCIATVNGEEIAYGSNQKYNIRYNFGSDVSNVAYDAEALISNTTQYTSEGFLLTADNINSIATDTINFFLIYNKGTSENPRWIILDYDSCVIARDGRDGSGYLKLELDNEVDGVVIGDDTDLDLESGQTVDLSVGFKLFRGSERLNINKLTVTFPGETPGVFNEDDETYVDDDGLFTIRADKSGAKGFDTLYFSLKDQFDFGEDRRVSVKIVAENLENEENVLRGEANYIILGVRGGKDGMVYKLVPSADYIIYDPNADKANPPLDSKITCVAYLGTEQLVDPDIRYTYDSVLQSEAQVLNADPLPVDGVLVEAIAKADPESTEDDDVNHYITFYLVSEDGQFVDRETVPVIRGGLDGVAVRLELGNELDAVSVGDDTDLDLEDDVVVRCGTSVRVLFGQDPLTIKKIVAKPEKSGDTEIDALWDDPNIVDIKYGFMEETSEGDVFHPVDVLNRPDCYVQVNLKNGFEFGKDHRERLKIMVTYIDPAGQEKVISGYYVLIGVKGGKDGAVFKIMPDRDYIRYYADQGIYDTGTDMFGCRAYYGSELVAGDLTPGESYSRDVEAKLLVLNYVKKIETFTDAEIEGGGLDYPEGGVDVDDYRQGPESTNMIVFYLAVKVDGHWLIVDRESVPIVSDGLDGADNLKIELDNEVEPVTIGVGDKTLDLPEGHTGVTVGTGAVLVIGRDPQDVINCELDLSDFGAVNVHRTHYDFTLEDENGNTLLNNATSGTFNAVKKVYMKFVLKDKFNFGNDYKRRVIITLTSAEGERARAVFFIVGLRFGKDGATYRVMPNPDYVLYDYEQGQFIGGFHVTCRALCNGMLMSSGTYKIFYTHTYPGEQYNDTVYDITTDSLYNIAITNNYFHELPEGGSVEFQTPTDNHERSQVIVFYMFVKSGEEENDWTCVDRETVPLVLNGKIGAQGAPGRDGNDGEGTLTFDLLNPMDTVTTGADHVLDLDAGQSVDIGTEARFCSGSTELNMYIDEVVPVQDMSANAGKYTLNITGNGTQRPKVELSLMNGFSFTKEMRVDFDVKVRCGVMGDTLRYTVNALANGTEGAIMNIRANAGTVVYDPKLDKYYPNTLTAALYMNNDEVTTPYTMTYQGCYLADDGRIVAFTQETSGDTISDVGVFMRSGGQQVISGVIYFRAYSGGTRIDYTDIQVVSNGLDGSGVIFDLSNEMDVVALGDDQKLDLNEGDEVRFETHGSLFNGSDQLNITGATVSLVGLPAGKSESDYITWVDDLDSVVASTTRVYGHWWLDKPTGSNENSFFMALEIGNGFDFSQFQNMKLDFEITVSSGSDTRSARYSFMGLKGGKDGYVFKVLPSHSTIKLLDGGAYNPPKVSATAMYGTDDINALPSTDPLKSQFRMFYSANDGDPMAYTMGSELTLATVQPIDFLTFYLEFQVSPDRWVLVDKEDIPVVRDGIDGIGSVVYSLSDYEVTVGTGGDHVLNVPDAGYYDIPVVYAMAESGDTMLPIKITYTLADGDISDYNGKLVIDAGDDQFMTRQELNVRLLDGFVFPESLKVDMYINILTDTASGSRTRTLTFSIIGVPAGKDGVGFKIYTNTRTVIYDSNAKTFTPSGITAEMFYGSEPFDKADIKYDIYYGAQKLNTNPLPYSGPIDVAAALTEGTRVKVPSKFVFNASGNTAPFAGVHLDYTDVAVINTGKDGSGLVADLSNDYDYISLGEDTVLNNRVEIPTTYASLYNGMNQLEISSATIDPSDDPVGANTTTGKTGGQAYYQQGSNGPKVYATVETITGDERVAVNVVAESGFDFGDLYNMAVSFLITLGTEGGTEAVVKYSLIGVKGGRDGYIYKLEPSVGTIVYDYEVTEYDPTGITCTLKYGPDAYTVQEWEASGVTIFYQKQKYDQSVTLIKYTGAEIDASGINKWITFVAISGLTGSPSSHVIDPSDVILDVEQVPVINSGIIGRSGVVFDLTNENDTITTGSDAILDLDETFSADTIGRYVDVGTGVICREAYDLQPVTNITFAPSQIYSGTTLQAELSWYYQDDDNTKPYVKARLYNGLDFGKNMELSFKINVTGTTDDGTVVSQTLTYKIHAVANGTEGKRYTLRPYVGSIVYNSNAGTYNDAGTDGFALLMDLYINEERVPYADYNVTAKLSRGLSEEIDVPFQTYNGYILNVPNSFNTGIRENLYNCILTLTAYSGSTRDVYLDHCDIPIVASGKDGSGLVADLTNEFDMIYLGEGDSKLDTTEDFETTLNVYSGTSRMTLSEPAVGIEGTGTTTTNSGKWQIVQSGLTDSNRSLYLKFRIISGFDFKADGIVNNKVKCKLSAKVAGVSDAVEKVYTITGVEGGQDGQAFRIVATPNAIMRTESGLLPDNFKLKIATNVEIANAEFASNYSVFFQKDNDGNITHSTQAPFYTSSDYFLTTRTMNIADAFNGVTSQIRVYLCKTNSTSFSDANVLDQETIPILTQGKNGKGGVSITFDPQPKFVSSTTDASNVTMPGGSVTLNVLVRVGDQEYAVNSASVSIVKANNGGKNLGTLIPGKGYTASTTKHDIPSGDVSISGSALTVTYPTLVLANAQAEDGVVFTVSANITYEDSDATINGYFTLLPDSIFANGSKGDRGPKTRVREWKDDYEPEPAGTNVYQAGGEGDAYWDIVYYVDEDAEFAGWFGCIQSHDPSSSAKPFVPDDRTVSSSNTYWTYYPDYDFLATKVITIGEGLEGWVIDKGKIQHMQSGVTLTSDGTVEVAETGNTYYKWTGSSAGYESTVYTKENCRVQATHNTMRDNGQALKLYTLKTDSHNVQYMQLYRDDFALVSGSTYSSPKMGVVVNSDVNNVKFSVQNGSSLGSVKAVSDKALSNTFTFGIRGGRCIISLYRYRNDLGTLTNQYGFIITGTLGTFVGTGFGPSKTEGELTFSRDTSTSVTTLADSTTGSTTYTETSALSSAVTICNNWLTSSTNQPSTNSTPRYSAPSFNPDDDVVLNTSDAPVRLGELQVAVDELYDGDRDGLDNEELIVDGGGGGGTSGGNVPTVVDEELTAIEAGWVYSRTVYKSRLYEIPTMYGMPSSYSGPENVYFDRAGSASVINVSGNNYLSILNGTVTSTNVFRYDGASVTATGTYIYTQSASGTEVTLSQGAKMAVLNSTDRGKNDEHGKIAFAAGIGTNSTLFRWVNVDDSTDEIFTKYQYSKTNTYDTYLGGPVSFYDNIFTNGTLRTDVLPVLAPEGTLILDGNGNLRILYGGEYYTSTGSYNITDVETANLGLAKMRIYSDGLIVGDGICVTNGKFYGTVNATDGVFSGTVNARSGIMNNVTVTNGTFNGNIDLYGGNTISIYSSSSSSIPSVILSSEELAVNQSEYVIPCPSSEVHDYNEQTFHQKDGAETRVLFTQTIPSGATLYYPSVSLRWYAARKVAHAQASVYLEIGSRSNTRSLISTGLKQDQSLDETFYSSGSGSISITADTQVRLIFYYDYTLKVPVLFNPTPEIYMNFSALGQFRVKTSGGQVRQVRIGPNGFAYVDGLGGEVSAISNGGGTTIRLLRAIQSRNSTYYNGIFIDNDEVSIYCNSKVAKFNTSTNPGAITWESQ